MIIILPYWFCQYIPFEKPIQVYWKTNTSKIATNPYISRVHGYFTISFLYSKNYSTPKAAIGKRQRRLTGIREYGNAYGVDGDEKENLGGFTKAWAWFLPMP